MLAQSSRGTEAGFVRILSWNLNARRGSAAQVDAMQGHAPDLVVLQEVTPYAEPGLREALAVAGLRCVLSGSDVPGRQLGRYVLIASRWPLERCSQAQVPAREVVICARVVAPARAFDVVGVHVPTIGRGLPLKLATQEGIAVRLRSAKRRPTIFCGDLNSPKAELSESEVIPFMSKRNPRVFEAEFALVSGLRALGMRDAFRCINGYEANDLSWWWKNRGSTGGYRLDHIFSSRHFEVAGCWYDHSVREQGLSDHSLIVAELNWAQAVNALPPPPAITGGF
jgi:exonuclease III